MALPADALERIRSVLEAEGTTAERLANLRQALPGVSLTRCDASDVDTETPALQTAGFDVFFIDTSEHCPRITADPATASGLIVAEKR
ncbi:hypothetical protein ACW73L_20935 [Methylolobus aquaticus]